jgi:hypothetical protein
MLRYVAPTDSVSRFPSFRQSSMSTDLAQLPLHALAAQLKSRSIPPVDIVDICLERIATLDPKLRAFP